MIVKDDNGNDVEVYTADEMNNQINQVKEDVTKQVTEQLQPTLDALQDKYNDAMNDLQKEKEKDKNFGNVRQIASEKEKEAEKAKADLETFKKEMNDKIESVRNESKSGVIDGMLDKLSGGNKELKDKIKYHYDSFAGTPESLAKIEERITNAYILATGNKIQSPLNSAVLSNAGGGGQPPVFNPSGEKLGSEAVELAKKLGISEKELKDNKLI